MIFTGLERNQIAIITNQSELMLFSGNLTRIFTGRIYLLEGLLIIMDINYEWIRKL